MIRPMGQALCPCGAWATHLEWLVFEASDSLARSNTALASLGIEPVTGCWSAVCDDCCDPTTTHKEHHDAAH